MGSTKKKEILIIGARIDGHAGVVLDALNVLDEYKVTGFIDNTPGLQGVLISGIPVIGSSDNLEKINFSNKSVHIAIGDNIARSIIYKKLKELNVKVVTIIHPQSFISENVIIGEGCYIAPGVIIINNTKIGSVSIINSGAIIEHDNIIGHAVHIAPGTVTAGRVKVNDFVFVGVGSTILPDIEIGNGAMVGAGSTVVKNVEKQTTVLGYAAKIHNQNIYADTQSNDNRTPAK
jgi:sugar O-acyltransferase (sialic acid O-acetyltransferase NeuD family)